MSAELLPFQEVPGKSARTRISNARRSNFLLSSLQKADARAALLMLEGSGIGLAEAARLALDRRRAVKSITVSECANLFLRSRLESTRPHTFAFYESRIGIFSRVFALRQMNDVTRAAVREWVASLDVSELTRRGYTRAIRAMWRWAAAQEPPLAGEDVTGGMEVTPDAPKSVAFLTVPECEAILRGAGHHLPAVALSLFAGIRPHEVAGVGKDQLLWSAVNVAERMIRIPPAIAKTDTPRIIEGLPDALWAWLGEPGKPDEPVSRALAPQIQATCAALAGFGARAERKRKWPADGLRHTFATYAVAFTGDASKVALWLGHTGSPQLLHRHYRGMASKAEGDKFFALRP